MNTATFTIEGISNYQQRKPYSKNEVPAIGKENHEDYERRTWRSGLHVNEKGKVFMPGVSMHKALVAAAAFAGEKIKGKGSKTYTQRFKAGIMVMNDSAFPIAAAEIAPQILFVPSDGKPGGGKRVTKYFGTVPPGWRASFEVSVFDELITDEVLARTLIDAGKFVGLGVWRPERGGYNGRFEVVEFAWNGKKMKL